MHKLKSRSPIYLEQNLWLYWARIDIWSDNETRETSIFAGISAEKLNGDCDLQNGQELTSEQKNNWVESVIKKWLISDMEIFETKIHYDTNGDKEIRKFLDFFLSK